MPLTLKTQAILFDMDGTLVDSGAVISRVLRRWGDHHGIDRERIANLPRGQRTSDTIAGLAPHLDLKTEVASLDAAEHGDLEGVTEISGAAKLVAAIPAERWALVTSADEQLARLRMTAAGLPLPSLLISGASVKKGKPSPEGYLLAAERLGRRPHECVVFEDAPAGVAAGIAAGMRVIGVASTATREELTACTAIVSDLTAVSVTTDGSNLTLTIS